MKDGIKKYDFKTGLSQEFEMVNLAQLYEKWSNLLTNPHRTDFYQIIWFQSGEPTHLVDFNPVKIKPNTVLFLNRDTVHRFDSKVLCEGQSILFTESFFCKSEADTKLLRNNTLFDGLSTVSSIQIRPELISNLWQLMFNELQNDKEMYQADILKNLLHNFLMISEREKRKQDNNTELKKGVDLDYVLLFKDAIEKNYRQQKQVKFYTNQIIITEKRLNQATTKILGKSPKEIIDDRIMLEAKRLLANTNKSAKEIGFLLGFDEPTNFIKYFKKHNQSTPILFREKFVSK
jgi:AraC-like DNA-binding protein